jgi:hypothetical protein
MDLLPFRPSERRKARKAPASTGPGVFCVELWEVSLSGADLRLRGEISPGHATGSWCPVPARRYSVYDRNPQASFSN